MTSNPGSIPGPRLSGAVVAIACRDVKERIRRPGSLFEFDMPKVKTVTPKCKACGDTGKNSNGGPCVPCVMNGRIKPK